MPPDRAWMSGSEEKLCLLGLVFELWGPSRTVDILPSEVPRLGPPHTPCPPATGQGAVSLSSFLLFGKAPLKN